METALHRQLKARFGSEIGGRDEVRILGYRIDAVARDGELIEVQSGSLGPLRKKLTHLLPNHAVRVVKPVVVGRRIIRRAYREGPDLGHRRSPRRGEPLDVFTDLLGLIRVFPHPNLRIDVLSVDVDEVRTPRRRRPGYTVVDRRLSEVLSTAQLIHASDLWDLIPAPLPDRFTTRDLAAAIQRPVLVAQRVAYCLRTAGAATVVGKLGNHWVYRKVSLEIPI